jgi:hypothetical protein
MLPNCLWSCPAPYTRCCITVTSNPLLATAGELVTRANGDASDRVGRQVELGQRGLVDPQQRLIGLHIYDGLLKVWRRCRGSSSKLSGCQALACGAAMTAALRQEPLHACAPETYNTHTHMHLNAPYPSFLPHSCASPNVPCPPPLPSPLLSAAR